MEKLLRALLLSLSRGALPNRLARRFGLRLGARRFVAGLTAAEAIRAVRALNAQGKLATLDHLGEFANDGASARHAADMCIATLDAIHESGAAANLSLKLTSLGLDIDESLCESHMRAILERAKRHGIFVRIDMEDYARCERSIRLFQKLRNDFDGVGLAIQAYLRRSPDDVRELGAAGANLRLVKGAYREPPEVALPAKEAVDAQFRELIRAHLSAGCYTAVATHDSRIVDWTLRFVAENGIPDDRYEFQMLYGIGGALQDRLVRDGCKVRVYVPFGRDWFGYFMRRLAERPANLRFVLAHLFR